MKKLLAIFVAAFELLAVLLPTVTAPTEGVTATVTVSAVCDVSPDTSSIDFGTLPPDGSTSLPETVTLTNAGNTDTTSLDVYGVDWSGAGGNSMDVDQTGFEDEDADSDDESLLLTPGTALDILNSVGDTVQSGILEDGDSAPVDFRVTVPVDQPADAYDQTITFAFEC